MNRYGLIGVWALLVAGSGLAAADQQFTNPPATWGPNGEFMLSISSEVVGGDWGYHVAPRITRSRGAIPERSRFVRSRWGRGSRV